MIRSIDLCALALTTLFMVAASSSCASPEEQPTVKNHSFARPDAVVKHIELNLNVDFSTRSLGGWARLYFDNRTGTDRLFLDTRGLVIGRVTQGDNEEPVTFTLGDDIPSLGRALIIDVNPDVRVVTVYYQTSPGAQALQWLDPEQTAGKTMPFLYTQSEPILARSWVPCQDNPGVRFTYRATVQVPPGMMALMSAQNQQERAPDGKYEFIMPRPIPSYLLALAAGDLAFRKISDRAGVYAEPSVVDTAAWEFADTEKMIAAAEKLYGPYRWDRYDILVLPPSFPFGGMENPMLTFATPTILAGDRSLVAVVAHELAHSWSGNLVTNATWDDFWLNEGFTVYFERRIVEEVYGKEFAQMQAVLGYQDLMRTFDEMGIDSADTRLYLNLDGRDPDDGVSDVPYEKGYLFLQGIEEAVGRPAWDAFLHKYFSTFAFRSMTTTEFLEYLDTQLVKDNAALRKKIRADDWVYKTGLSEGFRAPTSTIMEQIEKELERWLAGAPASELHTNTWTAQEWLYFIKGLPDSISVKQVAALDRAFGFTGSGNNEIKYEWFIHVIRHGYIQVYSSLERFLTHIGRRKLLKPLYVELAKTAEGLAWARRVYEEARPGYHSVTRRTIDELLSWNQASGG